MQTSTIETSRETLWKWLFGLVWTTLLLIGSILLFSTDSVSNDSNSLDERLDYDTRVPSIIAALPRCIHSCLIPRVTDLGCAHSNYACLCRNLNLLDDDYHEFLTDGGTSFEECAQQCDGLDGADLKRSPGLILDLCEALEEPVILPAFMSETLRIYGRQFFFSSSTEVFATPTVTETLPWGENPSAFPSLSFDGSEFIVFVPDTSISTFFSTTTLISGAAAYTSTVTAHNSPAVTEIVGVAQAASRTAATGSASTNTLSPSSGGLPSGAGSASTNTSSPSPGGLSSGAKIGIGVGIALVVVLLALALGWFIIVHRRKARRGAPAEIQQEKNDGGLPEHISTIDEIALASKSARGYSKTAEGTVSVPQEVADTQVYMGRNELPAYSTTGIWRHELQESTVPPQRTELGSGAENQIQDSSKHVLKPSIQRKAVSPEHSPFPPPWVASPQQGNDGRPEQSSIGQPQEETRYTTADEMVVEPDEHDPELIRLEEEMAKIKAERERLQRLQDLELKEEKLKRTIEERRKGGGGPSGG